MRYTFLCLLAVMTLTACETPLTKQGTSGAQYGPVETGAHSLSAGLSDRQSIGRYNPASGRFYATDTLQHKYILQLEYEDDMLIVDQSTGESVLHDTVRSLAQDNPSFWRYESSTPCPDNPWLTAKQPLAYQWDTQRNRVLMWVMPNPARQAKPSREKTYAAVCFYLVD